MSSIKALLVALGPGPKLNGYSITYVNTYKMLASNNSIKLKKKLLQRVAVSWNGIETVQIIVDQDSFRDM